jgi:hypothetical protein
MHETFRMQALGALRLFQFPDGEVFEYAGANAAEYIVRGSSLNDEIFDPRKMQ